MLLRDRRFLGCAPSIDCLENRGNEGDRVASTLFELVRVVFLRNMELRVLHRPNQLHGHPQVGMAEVLSERGQSGIQGLGMATGMDLFDEQVGNVGDGACVLQNVDEICRVFVLMALIEREGLENDERGCVRNRYFHGSNATADKLGGYLALDIPIVGDL